LKDENRKTAERQLTTLFNQARLKGDFFILPDDDRPIHETIQAHSSDAYLILMGMPGERAAGLARLFSLDRIFFENAIQKFEKLPPLLFVKAHKVMQLTE